MKRTKLPRLNGVLIRLGRFCEEHPIYNGGEPEQKEFRDALDRYLNWLVGQDCFGTEGQADPRGDHRNDD